MPPKNVLCCLSISNSASAKAMTSSIELSPSNQGRISVSIFSIIPSTNFSSFSVGSSLFKKPPPALGAPIGRRVISIRGAVVVYFSFYINL